MYEDLGLLTADRATGEDVADLFNQLSGYARATDYERLLVAPHSVRSGLVQRIEREVWHQENGRPAGIRFKVNSIVDEQVIDALYRASQAGVPIDILVRGICAVRPGRPGMSDTIRVRSILGRFLEHSRLYMFENGGNTEVFIGSADLMHRNLDRRVEALVRLASEEHVAGMRNVFDLAFDDGTAAWHLDDAGRWHRKHHDSNGQPLTDLQTHLIALHHRRQAF
jgi:polyphosphate kinase